MAIEFSSTTTGVGHGIAIYYGKEGDAVGK
jgi:hypothetical protein